MSYDINQSQGPYNDGRNQMAGQPALNQPMAPNQVPITPDEGMWRKFSSHYEFPISILIAILVHVFAVLIVIAYMALAFYFADPKPPDMETITFAGGGGEGDDSQEEFKPEVKDEIKIDLEEIDKVVIPDKIVPDKNQFELEATKRQGDKGKGGSGSGGGKGNGIGTGEGDGVGPGKASGARLDRTKRWQINFKYEDPESFVEKLANLKVVVGARVNSGRFNIYEEMDKPPFKFREMNSEEFQKLGNKLQRLYVQNRNRDVCESFQIGVNMSERPNIVFIFIPKEMEDAILKREEAYHGLKEAEIKKRKVVTKFDVTRTGNGWKVDVLGTYIDNTLKYDDDTPAKK